MRRLDVTSPMVMKETEIFSTRMGESSFDGPYLCLHLVRSGFASTRRAKLCHPLVEDGYVLQNVGSHHTVRAGATRVVTFCLPDHLVGGQRFAECLTPHDFYVNRALSRFVEALRTGEKSEREHWAEGIASALIDARDKSKEMFYLQEMGVEDKRLEEMRAAREFILARLARPLSVSAVANHCALSPFHFHRVFTEWHGITPGRYILKERVRRACRRLVLTNQPIAHISAACGFLSSTSFAGAFKGATGFSPSDFRKMTLAHRSDLRFFLC